VHFEERGYLHIVKQRFERMCPLRRDRLLAVKRLAGIPGPNAVEVLPLSTRTHVLPLSLLAAIGPLQANKNHSFHKWRGKERREALAISGAERSPEGRGSEHGAVLGYAPRRAAQAGLTEGAERSARLRRETNVRKEDQPKAVPLLL
jgi:hypothetical protein